MGATLQTLSSQSSLTTSMSTRARRYFPKLDLSTITRSSSTSQIATKFLDSGSPSNHLLQLTESGQDDVGAVGGVACDPSNSAVCGASDESIPMDRLEWREKNLWGHFVSYLRLVHLV